MSRPAKPLKSGKDYPSTWNQFTDRFPDEYACLVYLKQLRWPKGLYVLDVTVPIPPSKLSRGRLMCRQCKYQCTLTAVLFARKPEHLHVKR